MNSTMHKAARGLARLARVGARPAVRLWEHGWIRKLGMQPLKHQPVFIIGAPRTGSTILYQALTNHFDVLYIDNLACRWHDNLLFGMWLSHRRFGHRPHKNFVAERGSTIEYGDHAPSECGGFWYRWLGKEDHFVDDAQVSEEMVDGIRRELTTIINRFDAPLILKNLNAGQRLRLLARCFPHAKFIYIRRGLDANRKSILKARQRAGIKPGEWWSVRPPGFRELLALPEWEMVTAQIAAIEIQIALDLQRFPPANVFSLQCDQLSSELIQELGQWLGAAPRSCGSMPEFRKDAFDGQGNA